MWQQNFRSSLSTSQDSRLFRKWRCTLCFLIAIGGKIANMKQFHHICTGHPLLRGGSIWKYSAYQVWERSWWRSWRIWDSSSTQSAQVRTFVPAASIYCVSGILIVTNSLIGSKNVSLTLVLRDLPLMERFKVRPISEEISGFFPQNVKLETCKCVCIPRECVLL